MAKLNFRRSHLVFQTIFLSAGALMSGWIVVQDLISLLIYGRPDIADGCGIKSRFVCGLDAASGGYVTLLFGSVLLSAVAVFLKQTAERLRHRTGALVLDQDRIVFHQSFGIDGPIPLADFTVLRLNFDPNQQEKKTEYWSFDAKSDLLNLSFVTSSGRKKHYNISANLVDGGRIALSKFISVVEEQR
jgi:hypothetical protein